MSREVATKIVRGIFGESDIKPIDPMISTEFEGRTPSISSIPPEVIEQTIDFWDNVSSKILAAMEDPEEAREVKLFDGTQKIDDGSGDIRWLTDNFIPEHVVEKLTHTGSKMESGSILEEFSEAVLEKVEDNRDKSVALVYTTGLDGLPTEVPPVIDPRYKNTTNLKGYRVIIEDDLITQDTTIKFSSSVDIKPDEENEIPKDYRHQYVAPPNITNQESGYMVLRFMSKSCIKLRYAVCTRVINKDTKPTPNVTTNLATDFTRS